MNRRYGLNLPQNVDLYHPIYTPPPPLPQNMTKTFHSMNIASLWCAQNYLKVKVAYRKVSLVSGACINNEGVETSLHIIFRPTSLLLVILIIFLSTFINNYITKLLYILKKRAKKFILTYIGFSPVKR